MHSPARARTVVVAAGLIVALVATLTSLSPATAATLTSGGFTTSGKAPSRVKAGSNATVSATVKSSTARTVLVDLEIYDPSGAKAYQRAWDNQRLSANTAVTLSTTWAVAANAAPGTYIVKIGIFSTGWGQLYHWNDHGATTSVTSSSTSTTSTTKPSTTSTSTTSTSTSTTSTSTSTSTTSTTTTTIPSGGSLPPLPSAWPRTFELGEADSPGGAAALRAVAPFGFRYQYLAGGVNTGNGWANWNANGDFVTYYVQDSRAQGIIPVFTYYQIFQSNPGVSQGEPAGIFTNLSTPSTMAAYYNDLKLFFQKAGAAGGTTVLHVEPDLWAYLQQKATNDDATTVPVKVNASGQADVAGLPDNAAGFAQAIVRLRDRYAPNVILGYHFSTWGTGTDIIYADPSDATVPALGTRTANFERSLGAHFDIAFTDLSDRDAAFKQYVYGDGGASWYTADDYRRSTEYIGAFDTTANLRTVLWQVPLGNTKMLAENNTWNHYQDNKVEWLLTDATRGHINAYMQAGVVAVLFGRGADGATCSCDANGDGVTNPAPIDGNNGVSLNADDDGGYFKQQAAAYYNAGRSALP